MASDVVENVAYERFYEISGKTHAVVEWPGGKGGELIFTVTHCVSSILFSHFTHNTIISIEIYQVFTVFHWMGFVFLFIRAQGQHIGITWNTDCACCWKWHRRYGTASRKSECRELSLIWHGQGTRSSSQLHIVEGKAHFHVLSGAALIGASSISVEDDVKIDSLVACCVERVEGGLLLFPEANISWLALDSHNTTFPGVELVSGWEGFKVFVTCRISAVSKQGWWINSLMLERKWECTEVRVISPTVYFLGNSNFLSPLILSFPLSFFCCSHTELLLVSLMKHTCSHLHGFETAVSSAWNTSPAPLICLLL